MDSRPLFSKPSWTCGRTRAAVFKPTSTNFQTQFKNLAGPTHTLKGSCAESSAENCDFQHAAGATTFFFEERTLNQSELRCLDVSFFLNHGKFESRHSEIIYRILSDKFLPGHFFMGGVCIFGGVVTPEPPQL